MAEAKVKVSKRDIPEIISDKGVDSLIEAVIKKAVQDYEKALINQKTAYGTVKAAASREVHALEKFFRSAWGSFLTYDNGELIIQITKRRVGVGVDD